MEFAPAAVPTESTMVRYFEEGLKPSIKVGMDQDAIYLDNYEELITKAVRAEAKADLQPSFYVWETDLQVFRGSWPAYTTAHKVQTQGAVNLGDDSKATKTSTSTQKSKPSNKARKDKKKMHYRDKRDSSTSASGVNKVEVSKDRQRKRNKKDLNRVTYFNCNKKGHFSNRYLETPKN